MTHFLATETKFPPLVGIGNIGNLTDPTTGPTKFTSVLSQIIGVMTIIGALWFLFQLFTGALSWIGAGSDKQAIDNAKKKLTNAFIGLFVVVISYALLGVVGYFLGIDFINLSALINTVVPT